MDDSELNSDLHRYIASFDDILDEYDGNLYNIQEKYIKSKIDKSSFSFNPIKFLATNAKHILPLCKNGVLSMFNKHYKIFYDSKITHISEDNITNLFIESRLQNKKWERDDFDSNAYMSQHYFLIQEYFYKTPLIEHKAERFYVEYGFYNNIVLEPVNGLIYLASLKNPDSVTNEQESLNLYFSSNNKEILSFNPYLYVASNYNSLKHLLGNDRCLNERKFTKHYIVTGRHEGLRSHCFDHYKYLANNIKLLNSMMVDKNGNRKYDIVKVNPINVAKMFILKNGKIKNTFDSTNFVKLYFNDELVNYDKKLCVDNAHIYFVRSYITYSFVRWRHTNIYKSLQFIRNRIYDGVRQFPFHAVRFFLCSR